MPSPVPLSVDPVDLLRYDPNVLHHGDDFHDRAENSGADMPGGSPTAVPDESMLAGSGSSASLASRYADDVRRAAPGLRHFIATRA